MTANRKAPAKILAIAACVLVLAGCATAILATAPSNHSSPPAATPYDARRVITAVVVLPAALAFSLALLYHAFLHADNLHAFLVRNGNLVHLALVTVQIPSQLLSWSDPAVVLPAWCFALAGMFFVALFGNRRLVREVCSLVTVQSVLTAGSLALYRSPCYSVLAVVPFGFSVALWFAVSPLYQLLPVP